MSFTFNGIESTTHLVVNTVRQSILPPVASKMIAVPKRAGAIDFGVELGVRQIEVTVTVKGTSHEDLRAKARQIADWLYHDGLKPLVFSDEPQMTYNARVAGETDIEEIVYVGQGVITFLCPEPFATGQLIEQTIAAAKPEPVFTRASVAYDADGVAYAVNQPRYLAGQHGQAVQLEEGTTNLLQTALAPAQETLTLTPGIVYTLSSAGTGQDVVIDHTKTDDLTTGTKAGTYNEGTDLKLTLAPAFSDTDTTQADFNGTHSNTVATAEGNVELTKTASGTNFNKVETTQADFNTGTLTDVVATAGGELELGTTTSTSTNTIIKKATFETAPFTVDGFYAWNGFTQSSAQKYTGTYSYTTNVSGATCVFTIPVGATSPLYWYNYQQSSGQTKMYLNNNLVRTTNADPGYWYSPNAASLVAGTTYTVRWDSGDGGVFRQYIDDFEVRWNETVTTYPYKATGSRISPSYDISSVGEVASSTVSWTQVLPSASTTVVVEVSTNGGSSYAVASNGGTIPGLNPGTLTNGKNLRWKITLSSSNNTQTPKVSDITFTIVAKDLFNTTGTYTSPVLNLTPCTVMTSNINWTDVVPAGAGVTVQTNYSANGSTWAGWVTASKNGAISGLSNGVVVASGAKLQYRASLTPTANRMNTAQLQDITLTIDKANSGTRTSPSFSLTDVESFYSSNISWTATVPVGASLTVETSINGGSSWQAATNGGAISGLSGSLSGVSLLTRANLQTVTAPNPPTLHSLTVKVAARKTGSQFTITPATNQTILTPSGVTKWQLEERAYKTTFTVGTREPERLTLNMGGGLNSDQGTFEVRAYEDGTTTRYAAIWDSYGTDMGSRFLLEKLTDSTYELYFNNALAIKTQGLASVGSHVFAARWNGKSVWLLIDGVQVGTAALAVPVDMSKNEFICLGSRYNNTRQWNGIIDEVRSSLVARTTTELLADAAGGPLPLDENTSCKLEFNGNMGVGAIEYPSLIYDGTARTYPLFTLLVKAPISYVKLMKGSKQILVTHDFQPGDILVIDNDRATIKVNGLRAMRYLDVTSDFFMLDRGLNEFTLEPASKCNVDIQYREKWL